MITLGSRGVLEFSFLLQERYDPRQKLLSRNLHDFYSATVSALLALSLRRLETEYSLTGRLRGFQWCLQAFWATWRIVTVGTDLEDCSAKFLKSSGILGLSRPFAGPLTYVRELTSVNALDLLQFEDLPNVLPSSNTYTSQIQTLLSSSSGVTICFRLHRSIKGRSK